MTTATLEIAPRPTGRGPVSNTDDWHPIDPHSATGQALIRAARPGYTTWLDHVRPAGACTRPIHLAGVIDTIDPATGQRLSRLATADLPDGHLYKACGNRRATVCPACAEVYRRDAYHLLRAGLVGGKGVPASVASHDAVFVTFTAPSFGTVHTRVITRHTCTNRRRCDCRPNPCHARRDTPGPCPHGQPRVCFTRHEATDPRLGRPLCLDCYDHDHQVVWNHHTGELWHRTKQAIDRHLAKACRQRGIPFVTLTTPAGTTRRVCPVRVAHGKVAEFQTRGAVHFHALLRLDGVHPLDPSILVPPPAGITIADLDDAVRHAATIGVLTAPHVENLDGWPITWGEQVDIRHITVRAGHQVTDEIVASYLAKYATKSTEVTGHHSTRLTADTIDAYADPDGDHIARLLDACWRLGAPAGRTPSPWTCPTCRRDTTMRTCPTCRIQRQGGVDTGSTKPGAATTYPGLRRWAHMLGFGGHFLTKARRYSVTFQALRATRVTFRRSTDQPTTGPGNATIRTADHTGEETTLVVGTLTFAGIGWHTTGDALLANTAADLARSRTAAGREELAHELGSTPTTAPLRVAA